MIALNPHHACEERKMTDSNSRRINPATTGKMALNHNENISPLGSGSPQRNSLSASPGTKRMPLKLSIPSAKYQFTEPMRDHPSTAPVHSMSRPFGGTKFNHTPEFVAGSPLSAASHGSRFGTLSHPRLGEFDEMDDGFMLASPLISGFDSNGSLQINSVTASPGKYFKFDLNFMQREIDREVAMNE